MGPVADHLEELPLFPLNTVLFPYARVQLHVFEERYKALTQYCEEFDSPFGVALIRSGDETSPNAEPYLVGTTARIEKVHRYPDGRLHLSARGEHRFRIRRIDEDANPYLTGYVEPLVEGSIEEPNRVAALTSRTIETFQFLVQGMIARPDFNVEVQLPDDPMVLSFIVANFLEVDLPIKQHLIELTDTAERLARLLPLIEKQIVESQSRPLARLSMKDLSDFITPN